MSTSCGVDGSRLSKLMVKSWFAGAATSVVVNFTPWATIDTEPGGPPADGPAEPPGPPEPLGAAEPGGPPDAPGPLAAAGLFGGRMPAFRTRASTKSAAIAPPGGPRGDPSRRPRPPCGTRPARHPASPATRRSGR